MSGIIQFVFGLYIMVGIVASFVFWATLTSRYEAAIWRRIRALGLGLTWPYTISRFDQKKQDLQAWEARQIRR